MQVFIGNLPRNFNEFELRRLVERVVLPKGVKQTAKHYLFRSERLKRSGYKVFDKLTNAGLVRHGVALIEPDILAQRVIERLHNSEYRGVRLTAHEYKTRTNSNDRRSINWRQKSWDRLERRYNERRQPTIMVEKENSPQQPRPQQ